MNIVVLTQIRLFGDGLVASLGQRQDMNVVAVTDAVAPLRRLLAAGRVDVVLVDVTPGLDLYDLRALATEHPKVALVALGLAELQEEVIRCGRAGFSGYVARNASVDTLVSALSNAIHGRLACPSEISNGLLRALFQLDAAPSDTCSSQALTRRENEVVELITRGLSNKEIARELSLSVATVKHHVHKVLEKLQLARRTQVMSRVRGVGSPARPRVRFASRLSDDD